MTRSRLVTWLASATIVAMPLAGVTSVAWAWHGEEAVSEQRGAFVVASPAANGNTGAANSADTEGGSNATTAATATAAAQPVWMSTLEGHLNTGLQLKTERAELEAKIRRENILRAGLWSRLVSPGRVFGNEFRELQAKERAEAPVLQAPTQQIRDLEADIRVARAKGDQARVLVLRARLHELRGDRVQQRTAFLGKQVQSLAAGVKAEREQVIAVRRQAEVLNDKMDELQRAVNRDQLALSAALLAYDQAYFRDDHPAMLAGISQANLLQQRIVEGLKAKLALKIELNTLLRGAVSGA